MMFTYSDEFLSFAFDLDSNDDILMCKGLPLTITCVSMH